MKQGELGLHPVLALQAVNSRAKVIGERLQGHLSREERLALKREQAYLYELKNRAARILLDESLLRPVAVDRGALLVVGGTPVGVRGFHLPLDQFEGDVARAQGQERPVFGQIREAQATLAQVNQAVSVLTRIIVRRRVG
ncbi:hypothetical protein [Deinococcus radiotolerans]|uniref:Prefoldin subunit alpha n=1 Tax=Deinococcus radiotolerans TaxID=1309407 RepID=A0ABQ2FP66_9DEIO|nr:hypothetical protein [Deinococcus radiotolerans]GGL13167.1 hypothetical protein GCM10010844_34980 [Deinococcus radiotolerans]